MLDFSFGEILVIAVVAVIFLGPDKLPQAFVKVAKILRAVKKTISDAKDTLDREIHISEMKQDALEYKKKFEDSALKLKDEILESANLDEVKSEIEGVKKLNDDLDKSSVKNASFDEIEKEGKSIQNRLKNNLKSKKDTPKKASSIKTKDSTKSKISQANPPTKDKTKATKKTSNITKSNSTKTTSITKTKSDSTNIKRTTKKANPPKRSPKSTKSNDDK